MEEITFLRTDNHASNDHRHLSNQSCIPTNSDNSLKVIVVNCQGVQAKKCSLVSLANQYTPDIIVGTESWLTPAVNSSEIFPSNYNIYRHNCPDGYGGVFLAFKSNLISEELPLSTTCELVACKIHLAHHYLIVCSIYLRNYA